ncbi:FtsX-like permease family protein [Thalassotalea sp. G2M2-11]|uniref:FtsX-like permease family protein n=1 Tax=Thalassotalea sp. G2M2-11 TaxID=2787627 RepID=UPI0019D298DC|nr:FtsX-like permease family protein [Thalassotalea sp. G2M2-11]
MATLIDIKYALRLLFKAPKFTAMTLGVLIGGLSISLFTFSFLYTTVYKELPLPEGDSVRAVGVYIEGKYRLLRANEYQDVKDDLTQFAEFGVYQNSTVRVSKNGAGKNVSASFVRAGAIEFSRVEPIIGRTIAPADTEKGAAAVAMISEELWQSEFQRSEDVLSKTMMLNGVNTDVIGVMPKGYRFPNTAQIWLPLSDNVFDFAANESPYVFAYARVRAGVSEKGAELELSQAVNQVYQQNVQLYDLPAVEKGVQLLTFQMAQTGGDGEMAFAFLNGIAWIILLLACINVGNLLLARSVERQKETAIRAALGATTARLVSQLMWEGIIITLVGGVLSLLLVGAALDYIEIVLQSWLPSGGSFWWHYGMDAETVIVGVVFTLVTILLSGFLPAWRSAHQDINSTLRDGTRGAQSKKSGKVAKILVTTQIFLVAILMLIGAISGFIAHNIINLETGDDYQQVMSARFSIPTEKYPEPEQQLALLEQIKQGVEQHPSVVNVLSNYSRRALTVTIDGVDYASAAEKPNIDTIGVIGDTATVGVNLVAGRQLTHRDKQGARINVMISQSMANRYWPGQSPLEQSFTMNIDDKEQKVFVVGVVTNRLNSSTLFGDLASADEIYISGYQFVSDYQVFMYRVLPSTPNAEEIFYQAMFQADRHIELTYGVQPALYNRNKMRESMVLLSNLTFGTGFFALLLAMVGIYGLTANTVAQRTHEIGIRRAVGASDKHIIQLFLKQGAKQLLIGLGGALVIFALLSFGFHSLTEALFPVHMYFIQAFFVVLGLSVVVMAAVYLPTKRAVKMEPSTALRYE